MWDTPDPIIYFKATENANPIHKISKIFKTIKKTDQIFGILLSLWYRNKCQFFSAVSESLV